MKGNEQTGLTHFRVYTLVIYRIGVRLLLVFHRRFAEASGMVQVTVLTLFDNKRKDKSMETNSAPLFHRNPQAPPVNRNREQALLIGLMSGEQEFFYTNSLTTGRSREELSRHLSLAVRLKDKPNIQLVFNFLKEEGERSAYNIMISLFLSEHNEKKREALIKERFLGIDRFVQYCRNLSDFLVYIKENNTIEITNEDLQRGILAWDLGHLVSLARVSYDYGLLAEEEAWKYIEFAGKKCRGTFACWKEIGKSFLLGQIMSYPGEENFQEAIRYFLLSTESPESPWVKCKFG